MLAPPRSKIPVPPSLDGTPTAVAGASSTYRAFPGLAVLANAGQDLLAVCREGATHVSVDGVIRRSISTDDGATWDTITTIHTPAGGLDARDPEVVVLQHGADAGRVVVFFTETDGAGTYTPKLIYSDDDAGTWSSPVTITTSFTDWAFAHGMAELADGTLLCAAYGNDTGDNASYRTVRVSVSTDGAETWSHHAEVVDGQADLLPYAEPQLLVLHSDEVLCALRLDTSAAGAVLSDEAHLCRSTDGGTTWSAPVGKIAGSGKPAMFQRSDGLVYLAQRKPPVTASLSRFGDGRSSLQVSNNLGHTWSGPGTALDFSNASNLPMAYASMAELPSGQVVILYSLEASSTDADLFLAKLTGGA